MTTTTSSTTSATVTGLSPNTTYYFKVSAYNSVGGEGPQSSSYDSATTFYVVNNIPDTPTNVSATAGSSYLITLSWSAVHGATAYYLYYSSSVSGTYTRLTTTSSTSYTTSVSGTYYFKVSAYNAVGESPMSSYASATGRN